MNSDRPPPPVRAHVEQTDDDDEVALVVLSEGGRVEFRLRTDDLSDLVGSAIVALAGEGALRDSAPAIIQTVAAGMNPEAYHQLTEYHFAVDVWAAEFPALVDAWADAAAAHRAMRESAVAVEEARAVPGGIYQQPGSETMRVFD